MESACNFIKYFNEPQTKYVCFSTSLFYRPEYLKMNRAGQILNMTREKTALFKANMEEMYKLIDSDYYPANWYYRLYFDDSVNLVPAYVELLKKFQKHPKFQLVKYTCPKFKNSKDDNFHIGLFGTLVRFYSAFDPESVHLQAAIMCDADNYYSKKFVELFKKFLKSDDLVYGVGTALASPFYSPDMEKFNMFEYIHLVANATAVKHHPMFSMDYWHRYFDNLYLQKDLLNVFNFGDFRRFAYNRENNVEDSTEQSFLGFHYGADEIWANFVLKKVLRDNHAEKHLRFIFAQGYTYKIVISKILLSLRYNYQRNTEQFELFLKHQGFPSYDAFVKYVSGFSNQHTNVVKKLFRELRENPYFERLYLFDRVRFIIYNLEKLIKLTTKTNYYELVQTLKPKLES